MKQPISRAWSALKSICVLQDREIYLKVVLYVFYLEIMCKLLFTKKGFKILKVEIMMMYEWWWFPHFYDNLGWDLDGMLNGPSNVIMAWQKQSS